MKYFFFLGIAFLALFSSCRDSQSNDKQDGINTSQTTSNSASGLSEEDEKSLLSMKGRFDKGLTGDSDKSTIAQIYRLHAQRMRMDVLEQFPYTKYYPYTSKFSVAPEASELSFLTDQCGYLNANDEKVNFYCFTKDNSFFNYMLANSGSVPMVSSFIENYKEEKSITSNMKNQFLLQAIEELDFTKEEHQNFYMLVHALMNEEFKAGQKIAKVEQ
jgi:hypothetical protein